MAGCNPRGPLGPGDPVVFIDHKHRRYFAVLEEGGRQDIRGHVFSHDDLLGRPDGLRIESPRGRVFTVVRATLADYVVQMPRYATVIYPKDLATILVWGDIRPGLRVLEAGLGSGGLAVTLLRALGPEGTLYSYEVRTEALNRGEKNVRAYFGADTPNHHIKTADVYAGIDETGLDRIVLDVPEPWQVVPHAERALADGGIFVAYSPTILQVNETVGVLKRHGAFGAVDTYETLMRPWHVTANSVRPDLQMVGHTGFLTFARKVQREAIKASAPKKKGQRDGAGETGETGEPGKAGEPR